MIFVILLIGLGVLKIIGQGEMEAVGTRRRLKLVEHLCPLPVAITNFGTFPSPVDLQV